MGIEDKIKSTLREEMCENPNAMSISEGSKIDRAAHRIAFVFKEFIQWKDMTNAWGECNVRNIGFGYYDMVGEEHEEQYVIDDLFKKWIKKKDIY